SVRAHHQVPGVVRIEVQNGVADLGPDDHEAVLVGALRDLAERAAVAGSGAPRFVLALDVGHAMRRPQPLERVRLAYTLHTRRLRLVLHATDPSQGRHVPEARSGLRGATGARR